MSIQQQDFSPENTHDQNIQISVQKILGSKTNLRNPKRIADDHRKATFVRIINNLMLAEERNYMLDEAYDMNFERYDKIYLDTIEDTLSLCFNKAQMSIIRFFLIDRFTNEGVAELVDENEHELILDTAEDLWEVIKLYK